MQEKRHFSTTEAAALLGISRVAVFKQIRTGRLSAQKVGRNYIIAADDLYAARGSVLSPAKERAIDAAVERATEQYRSTFERLGKE